MHISEPDNGEAYRAEAKQKIMDVIDSSKSGFENKIGTSSGEQTDTWIYPLIQMGPFRITQDYDITQRLFQKAPEKSHIKLASGYFNLTDKYVATILGQSLASFNILTASPEVNLRLFDRYYMLLAA